MFYVRQHCYRSLCCFLKNKLQSQNTKPATADNKNSHISKNFCKGPTPPLTFYISATINTICRINHSEQLHSHHVCHPKAERSIFLLIHPKNGGNKTRAVSSEADGAPLYRFWPDTLQQVEGSAENVNSLTSPSQLVSSSRELISAEQVLQAPSPRRAHELIRNVSTPQRAEIKWLSGISVQVNAPLQVDRSSLESWRLHSGDPSEIHTA